MLKNDKPGEQIPFYKTRDFAIYMIAIAITFGLCGSFYYGGWIACNLGGGVYYKFACANLVEINITEKPQTNYGALPNISIDFDRNIVNVSE